jgi:arylsulfatase A-like enzyme
MSSATRPRESVLSWLPKGSLRLALLAAGVTAQFTSGPLQAADTASRPNILWISCEDISPHLGCYGDPHAITPHLDQLAREGVRYSHAFTTAGVCAPCRSAIITGMYQNSIGTHHMRCNATLPAWLTPFPRLLRDAGYYCTNNSKTDYQFKQPSADAIWDASSGKAHWKNRAAGQPFFAVFNFTGCHESGIASEEKYHEVTRDLADDQRRDPAALTTLPPYYPDTPITREDWKRNYELITAMDTWAGGLLDELVEAGVEDETIVFFWSDHGVGLPRAKRWLYDSGTHIPLIVRIPAGVRTGDQGQPGSVCSDLVSSVDFGPTVLNLAGLEVPSHCQGQPFLGEQLPPARQMVFGARDRMDERYDIIRSARDSRYRYIRNYEPLKPYYQFMNTPEKGATMQEIRRCEAAGTLTDAAALFTARTKPVEELYDMEVDPHELANLAGDPIHRERLAAMRKACLAWQAEIGDLGLIPEAEIALREQAAGSRFEILHPAPDEDFLDRLVRLAARASEGPEAIDDLLEALRDSDAAIRTWAATGLGNIGEPAEAQAAPPLTTALNDPSASVRIAAARALCRMGLLDRGLPVLQAELESPQEWGRLAAAIVLDELDEQARPALGSLQAALKDQPNKYIVRTANKAVNDLLGTDNRVP